MIRLQRAMRKGFQFLGKWFPILALAMAVGAAPVLPSDLMEPRLSPRERKILDEYRLRCRPGGFIEEVRANLDKMHQAHPGSAFLKDTAFLAEVHYLDRGSVWNANGKKWPGWSYHETFDSLFNTYEPSREAWRRSRSYGDRATGFAGLGILFGVANLLLGLDALMNGPPPGERSPPAYRAAQVALPIGWISSFIYGGICASRKSRAFDNAFFELNGRAIAERLAEDL